jgi:hypothetical protein
MAPSRTFQLEAGSAISVAAHTDEFRDRGVLLEEPAKIVSFIRIRCHSLFVGNSLRGESAIDLALTLDEARDVAMSLVESIEEAKQEHQRVEKLNEKKMAEAARGAASRNDAEGAPLDSVEV